MPEIRYGHEGKVKVVVTTTQPVTSELRDTYSVTWTDYEGRVINSVGKDYSISEEPSARLEENQILVHELTIKGNVINTVSTGV